MAIVYDCLLRTERDAVRTRQPAASFQPSYLCAVVSAALIVALMTALVLLVALLGALVLGKHR